MSSCHASQITRSSSVGTYIILYRARKLECFCGARCYNMYDCIVLYVDIIIYLWKRTYVFRLRLSPMHGCCRYGFVDGASGISQTVHNNNMTVMTRVATSAFRELFLATAACAFVKVRDCETISGRVKQRNLESFVPIFALSAWFAKFIFTVDYIIIWTPGSSKSISDRYTRAT